MANLFQEQESEQHWMSVSDLMSVLMMLFLFIAITYILEVQVERDKIREVAITYNRLQNDLYEDLFQEFKTDLVAWNAVLDRETLSLRFEAPEILFESGSAELNAHFKSILSDFFPRYISILHQQKYRADIEEIRIEGHTSSEWAQQVSEEQAYFYNMALSQDRTREVLWYCMQLPALQSKWDWMKSLMTANGLSSSKLIYRTQGVEDRLRSRRVEFRVRTNAEKRMVKILEAGI